MKYPHILEHLKPDKPEEVLVFDKWVDDDRGSLENTIETPDYWDNIRHICGNLFYAWENDDPEDGCVFLGHYEKKTK